MISAENSILPQNSQSLALLLLYVDINETQGDHRF